MDYDYSYDQFYFVNNGQMMDMFICKICQSVSKDPYETQCCKNTFCKSCIDKAKQKRIACCPMCRKQPYQIVQAVQISRQIQMLLVYCKNKNQGCTWTGALETKDMHLRECLFITVPCEYYIVGCNAMVTLAFQKEHNINEMEMHFSMVAKCVEENLKLSNSTKQQLAYSEQKLQDTKQQLTNSEQQLAYSEQKLQDTKQQLINSEQQLAYSEQKLQDTKQQLTNSEHKLQDTKQQLAYSERRLKNTKQELNESNKNVKFYKKFYEENKVNAIVKELEDTKVKLADNIKIIDKLTLFIVISSLVVVLIFSQMIKICFA